MIVKTITDEYYFWNWLKKSDSYKGNFSLEGAKAVQEYFENLSEDLGEQIEFDPIAWCVEFTEYRSILEAYKELNSDDEEARGKKTFKQMLEYFEDRTTVMQLEDGSIIVGEF